MSSVDIRIATRADLEAIYEIARASFVRDSFSAELLAEKLFTRPLPDAAVWETYLASRGARPVGFMQNVARPSRGRAWIGLFAVAAAERRRGIAKALFGRCRAAWPAETKEAEVLALPGNYFTPGLDPRYTTAIAFLESAGFQRGRDCANLRTDLAGRFDVASDEAELRRAAIEIRRARRDADDRALLAAFFAQDFGDDWRYEANLAMELGPPALHLAIQSDRIIAFSAHSTQNREWGFFGPMGTTPAARGKGVGRVLLRRCLNDLFDAGHCTAVIPWVGPISFYHRWAGSVVERVFWRYSLALA